MQMINKPIGYLLRSVSIAAKSTSPNNFEKIRASAYAVIIPKESAQTQFVTQDKFISYRAKLQQRQLSYMDHL